MSGSRAGHPPRPGSRRRGKCRRASRGEHRALRRVIRPGHEPLPRPGDLLGLDERHQCSRRADVLVSVGAQAEEADGARGTGGCEGDLECPPAPLRHLDDARSRRTLGMQFLDAVVNAAKYGGPYRGRILVPRMVIGHHEHIGAAAGLGSTDGLPLARVAASAGTHRDHKPTGRAQPQRGRRLRDGIGCVREVHHGGGGPGPSGRHCLRPGTCTSRASRSRTRWGAKPSCWRIRAATALLTLLCSPGSGLCRAGQVSGPDRVKSSEPGSLCTRQVGVSGCSPMVALLAPEAASPGSAAERVTMGIRVVAASLRPQGSSITTTPARATPGVNRRALARPWPGSTPPSSRDDPDVPGSGW